MKILISLIFASQALVFSMREPIYSQEKDSNLIVYGIGTPRRVYCSNKSLGFDLHFNDETGQLYSFDKFKNRLVPFNIKSEIPFDSYFPVGAIEDFLYEWDSNQVRIDSNIYNGTFSIKLYSELDKSNYLITTLDLLSLEVGIKLYGEYIFSDQRTMANNIAKQIKCEYITPESFIF